MASKPAICRDCGGPTSGRGPTGRCRSCANRHNLSQPETRARISRRRRAYFAANPVAMATVRTNLVKARDARDHEARRNRFVAEKLWFNGGHKNPAGSDSRRRAGRRCSATKLAWCPPELREHYHHLTKIKRLKAAEARAMIEDQHEVEMQRWLNEIIKDIG